MNFGGEPKPSVGDAIESAMAVSGICRKYSAEWLAGIVLAGAKERDIDSHIIGKMQLFIDTVKEYEKRGLKDEDEKREKLFNTEPGGGEPAKGHPAIV